MLSGSVNNSATISTTVEGSFTVTTHHLEIKPHIEGVYRPDNRQLFTTTSKNPSLEMIHFSYGTKALREASAKLLFASMFSSLFALRKAAAQNENEFTAEKKNCNRPSKRRRNRKPIKPRIVRQIGIALFLKTSTEKGILQLHSERKCARNE